MTGFFTDGATPESSPDYAASQANSQTPASYGEALDAYIGSSSTSGYLLRDAQRQEMGGGAVISGGPGGGFGSQQQGEFPNLPKKPADDINKSYGPVGPDGKQVKITDAPMDDATASLVSQAKADELDREGVIARFSNTHSALSQFAVGTTGFLLDPLNVGSLFLPGIGEDAAGLAAAKVGLEGIAAKVGARALQGASAGVVSQLPVSAIKYGLGQEEASDYDLRSAFQDMTYAAAAGAVLHAGFGAVGDAWKTRGFLKKEPAAPPEGAPSPEGPPGEGPSGEGDSVLNADAPTKYNAMNAAVSQIASGREVDTDPFFPEQGATKTLADVAQDQQALYRDGFSPGMTTGELKDGEADLFPEEEKTPEGEAEDQAREQYKPEPEDEEDQEGQSAQKQTAAEGQEKEGEGIPEAQPQAQTPEDEEIARLESQIDPEKLSPEDRETLDATKQSMDAADRAQSALKQTVACLVGGVTGEV